MLYTLRGYAEYKLDSRKTKKVSVIFNDFVKPKTYYIKYKEKVEKNIGDTMYTL